MLYSLFKHTLFRPVIKYVFRAKLIGAENIPASGGVILASNHIGAGETLVMPAMVDRQMAFPAKAELFAGDRGLASKVVAWFLKAVGQIPLDRSGGRSSMDGLAPVAKILAEGGVVGLYPEGTRSPDGRLYKGKTGVARLALTAGVPVIPVSVENTQIVKRWGLPWLNNPIITLGKPLDFTAYADRAADRAVLRWVTDEVMNAIREQSGQTYVDAYGSSVKSGALSPAEADARVKPRPGSPQPPALPS